MAKLKPNEKRVQLSFQRAEDVRLFEFMEKQAYEARYELSTFIIVALQKAFEGQVPEEQAIVTEEAAATPVEFESQLLVRNVEDLFPEEPKIFDLPPKEMPVLTPELEEAIRAKIAARTTRKSSAAGTDSPTPPASPR